MLKIRRDGRVALLLSLLFIGLIATTASPASAYPRPGSTTLLSGPLVERCPDQPPLGSGRGTGVGGSAISDDGRFIVFSSLYCDLVAGDDNGRNDVFRFDRKTGKVEMVSVAPSGAASAYYPELLPGTGSSQPEISGNGRFVAFASSAMNLTNDVIAPTQGDNIFGICVNERPSSSRSCPKFQPPRRFRASDCRRSVTTAGWWLSRGTQSS